MQQRYDPIQNLAMLLIAPVFFLVMIGPVWLANLLKMHGMTSYIADIISVVFFVIGMFLLVENRKHAWIWSQRIYQRYFSKEDST